MNVQAWSILLVLGVTSPSVKGNAAPSDALPDGSFVARMAQAQVEASETAAKLTQIRRQAAHIKIGTSRAQIKKRFSEDGGLMIPDITRYYVGEGVMMDVPYDQHGGPWKAQNRVNGAIHVYLSPPHSD